MTWLVWRQHRTESMITLGVLAVLAVFMLPTGPDMAQTSQGLGLTDCLAHAVDRSTCGPLEEVFQNRFSYVASFKLFVLLLPALFGALVGAPLLARELEQHTHLLVWTQSITRLRWLSVKLALVVCVALLAFGVLMALLIWWFSCLPQDNGRFTSYDVSGPVWLGAAVLALALGIFAGTFTRQTVLAVFLTIVLFLAIRVPVELYWRPNFEPAITVTWPLAQDNPPVTRIDQDWIISSGLLDAQGNQLDHFRCASNQVTLKCPPDGIRNYLTYQPADRFWTFQWIETGIYLGFSLLALFATFWLVRRRLS